MSGYSARQYFSGAERPKLSVWFVNFRSAKLIENSLRSLDQAHIDEICIWDNASGAPDVAILERLAADDSRVRLFISSVNLGFGSGMNAIADRTFGRAEDLIWLLNPDTELLAGSVSALTAVLTSQAIDIVSPLILCGPVDEPVIWFNGGGVDLRSGSCWHRDYGLKNLTSETGMRRTDFMTGAAPMMTRETWDKIGGFHDGLFLYWEDVELSLRARELKLSMAVHPECTVWHLEGGSGPAEPGHSTFYYFYNARNRIMVCATHCDNFHPLLGRGLRETFLSVLRPLVREKSGRIQKSMAAARGTMSGICKRGGLGPRRTAALASGVLNAYQFKDSSEKGSPS